MLTTEEKVLFPTVFSGSFYSILLKTASVLDS